MVVYKTLEYIWPHAHLRMLLGGHKLSFYLDDHNDFPHNRNAIALNPHHIERFHKFLLNLKNGALNRKVGQFTGTNATDFVFTKLRWAEKNRLERNENATRKEAKNLLPLARWDQSAIV